MVCAKCEKSQKKTELATPGVKRKNELYFGSPASNDKSKSSAASSASGIGKVRWAARCVSILVCSQVDILRTEQTPRQRCKKSIRSLQLHMRNVQDQSTGKSPEREEKYSYIAKQAIGRSRA